MQISYNTSLEKYNTFGMKAQAACLIEYETVAELQDLLSRQSDYPSPLLPIGGGSNLLFTTPLFEGTILHSRIKGWEQVDENVDRLWIKVGAGVIWDDFVAYVATNGWGGTENLSFIPGEVGASAVQNIGAYGVEVKDIIETVHAVDRRSGEEIVIPVSDCQYGYRRSIFKGEWKGRYIITHVTYRLDKSGKNFNLSYGNLAAAFPDAAQVTPQVIREHIIATRKKKLPDPAQWGNGGSFFMNPVVSQAKYTELKALYEDMPSFPLEEGNQWKIPAAWLIQQAGWKGKQLGRAGVYAHQPLVLINLGGAEAREIVRLAEEIIRSVEAMFGIHLSPEVIYIE